MRVQRFAGVVRKLGINPCVDVPAPIVRNLRHPEAPSRGPVPVRGTVNRTSIRATIVKYQRAWRLYLNTELRQRAGIAVGDRVALSLRFDAEPRVLPVPEELRKALLRNKSARKRWESLAPSHRREYLAYLNSLKTKESLNRNVQKTVKSLLKE